MIRIGAALAGADEQRLSEPFVRPLGTSNLGETRMQYSSGADGLVASHALHCVTFAQR